MQVIKVDNVNHALPRAMAMLRDSGKPVSPRGALTYEIPGPFATHYDFPEEMVLFDPDRDANPFFHFFEALWILRGRGDVAFLAHFLPRMAEFSDDGKTFHAPYGYRLRYSFGFDQIETCIEKLKADTVSRQAVATIWDPTKDFGKTKDVPCNDMIMFKIREGKLRMSVLNRSNDAVLGAYGANVVQFSTLLRYMAGRIGVGVGTYTQVSDSFHVYADNPFWLKWKAKHKYGVPPVTDPYELELNGNPSVIDYMNKDELMSGKFDQDIETFFDLWDAQNGSPLHELEQKFLAADSYMTKSFQDTVLPMYKTLTAHRAGQRATAATQATNIAAADWRLAVQRWMARRGGAA